MSWWNMSTLKEHPLVILFSTAAVAFGIGLTAYQLVLEAADLDVVREGTYTLNKDLEGRLIRRDAVREVVRLIDVGEALETDNSSIHAWLLESRTFVHELGLEKDSEWDGQKVATIERNMLWAVQDSSVELQVQKTLGVLRGLRAAFSSREP